jgi:hypothetical protein
MLKRLTSLLLVLTLTAGLALPALSLDTANPDGEPQTCTRDTYALEIEIHIFITAIRTNGSLWVWGLNGNGQVGNNTISNQTIPQNIMSGMEVTPLSLSTPFSAAFSAAGTDVMIAVLTTQNLASRRTALESQVTEIIDQLSAQIPDVRFSLVEIRGGSSTFTRSQWTVSPTQAKAALQSFTWNATSNIGHGNTALNNLYQHFGPFRNKHLLLITDTDYLRDPNYMTLDDAIDVAYNEGIALSVASTMPNRYSNFYNVERTGGISVDLRGNFIGAFTHLAQSPVAQVTGNAEIILKGGLIAEVEQWPNFTDAVMVDIDGIDENVKLIRSSSLTFMDFTLVAQHYGMTVPAGARALVPVFEPAENFGGPIAPNITVSSAAFAIPAVKALLSLLATLGIVTIVSDEMDGASGLESLVSDIRNMLRGRSFTREERRIRNTAIRQACKG